MEHEEAQRAPRLRRAGNGGRRDFVRDAAATTAIEFAILAPILIGVALATLQAAVLFLVGAFFETAAETAARIVLTNQTSALTAAQFQTAVCNQLSTLFTCANLTVELEPLPAGTTNLAALLPTFNASGQLQTTPPVDVGANACGSGEDMLLVVMYQWPVYGGPLGLNLATLGNGTFLMTSTQVFR
ncbi:MAG TPA: TadE/TadG family type IV pilus assembly protein, partial [Roseiarcus sp.]|nr:TadE/TadG family type IV pilus assembly protein [Roseiarcus sp.]